MKLGGVMRYLLVLLLTACSVSTNQILLKRGLSKAERQEHVVMYGSELSFDRQKKFVEGKICKKMPRDLVFLLYGNPSFFSTDNTIWEYEKDSSTILRIEFERDSVFAYKFF